VLRLPRLRERAARVVIVGSLLRNSKLIASG